MTTQPQDLVAAIRRSMAAEPDLKVGTLCRAVEGLNVKQRSYWTAREARARFSELLRRARTGRPQLVQPAGEALPMLVISLPDLAEMLDRVARQRRTWADVANRLVPVTAAINIPEAVDESVRFS